MSHTQLFINANGIFMIWQLPAAFIYFVVDPSLDMYKLNLIDRLIRYKRKALIVHFIYTCINIKKPLIVTTIH
jgi:hypothetical protein